MRIALISDIHGNLQALEAVMKDIFREGEPDEFIFMGDYISDCPNPREVLDTLYAYARKYRCHFIRGNREDYMLEFKQGLHPEWEFGSPTGSLWFTAMALTERDYRFFESIPPCAVIQPASGPAVTVCHASPSSSRESIFFDRDKVRQYAAALETRDLLCGHQHLVRMQPCLDKRVFFVGSCGLPNGFAGSAQYSVMTLENNLWQVQPRIVSYDVNVLLDAFDRSGLNEAGSLWTRAVRETIRTGVDYCVEMARLVYERADERGLRSPLPAGLWEEAAEILRLNH